MRVQGLKLFDDRPIYEHVETFQQALNLYRGEDFEKAAELVSGPQWLDLATFSA